MTRRCLILLAALVPGARAAAQDSVPAGLAPLLAPQLAVRADEQMLVVEARGDPRTAGGRAFGLLFSLYYRIPEAPKGPRQPAPRARWPVAFDAPREAWVGHYALPLPPDVRALPPHDPAPGLSAAIVTWEYGPVAEILHVGPYDREAPTLERLRDFVRARGYVITGEHEEEYVRGPTMTGPGDPERYLTILRYRVARRDP